MSFHKALNHFLIAEHTLNTGASTGQENIEHETPQLPCSHLYLLVFYWSFAA